MTLRRWKHPVQFFHLFTPDDSVVAYAEANPVDSPILVPRTDEAITQNTRWAVVGVKFGITHPSCCADGLSHRASMELIDNAKFLLAAAQEEIPGHVAGTLPTPTFPLLGDGFQTPWMTFGDGIVGRTHGSPLYFRQTNLNCARFTGFYIVDVLARRVEDDEI